MQTYLDATWDLLEAKEEATREGQGPLPRAPRTPAKETAPTRLAALSSLRTYGAWAFRFRADDKNAFLERVATTPHLQALFERLEAAVLAVEAMSDEAFAWIETREKLPEEGQRVLYYFSHVGMHVGEYGGLEDGMHVFEGDGGGWLTGDVTHWMPLPGTSRDA